MKLSISAKCSDCFSATLSGVSGRDPIEYDGYVPDFFPGNHHGDYIVLDIDPATGTILNWKKPSVQTMLKDMRMA